MFSDPPHPEERLPLYDGDHPTAAQLEAWEREHIPSWPVEPGRGNWCRVCLQNWPCPASVLVALVRAQRERLARQQAVVEAARVWKAAELALGERIDRKQDDTHELVRAIQELGVFRQQLVAAVDALGEPT